MQGKFELTGNVKSLTSHLTDFHKVFKVMRNDEGLISCWWHDLEVAKFDSIVKYKAAIMELATAIERGDEEFTFPDDTAKKGAKKGINAAEI